MLFRSKAQRLNPKDPIPYINIGAGYFVQKNYTQALKNYEEALKLDPDKLQALTSIVRIQVLQGKPKTAYSLAERHLEKTKNKAAVYQLLGQLDLQGKSYAKGIKHLEEAIKLNPDLLSAYFLIGNAYYAQKKFDEAVKRYEEVIQKNPRAIPAYMLLGY